MRDLLILRCRRPPVKTSHHPPSTMTSRRRPRAPRCRPSAALSHAAGEGAGGRVGAGPICAASRRQQQQLHARSPVRGRLRDPSESPRIPTPSIPSHHRPPPHSPSGRPLPGPSPRGETLVEPSISAPQRARRVEGVTPRLTRARVCGALRDWGPALILTPVRDRLDPRGHREAVRRRDAVSRHPNCPNSSLIASISTSLPPTTTITAHQHCTPVTCTPCCGAGGTAPRGRGTPRSRGHFPYNEFTSSRCAAGA